MNRKMKLSLIILRAQQDLVRRAEADAGARPGDGSRQGDGHGSVSEGVLLLASMSAAGSAARARSEGAEEIERLVRESPRESSEGY